MVVATPHGLSPQTPALAFTPAFSPVSVWAASDSSHRCVRAVSVNREGGTGFQRGPEAFTVESLVLGRLSFCGWPQPP